MIAHRQSKEPLTRLSASFRPSTRRTGRIIEAASGLRATKQAAERDAFIARVREDAAAIGLRPEELFAPAGGRRGWIPDEPRDAAGKPGPIHDV
jgi:hypothetical protein